MRQLNPEAQLVVAEKGDLPLDAVLDTGLFDEELGEVNPGWVQALNDEPTPETEEYGITSFVYRHRWPFHPKRLAKALEGDWSGVLRSKGFFWLATRPDVQAMWSQAGLSVMLEPLAEWMAAVPESEWEFETPEDRIAFDERWIRSLGTVRPRLSSSASIWTKTRSGIGSTTVCSPVVSSRRGRRSGPSSRIRCRSGTCRASSTLAETEPVALIGILTVSDRASRGEYEDRGGPGIRDYLDRVLTSTWEARPVVIADEQDEIESAIRQLAADGCCLVLTTGGTGPAERDVTVEATEAACARMLPGFGEAMRTESLKAVPTAILSRQTAGICEGALVINLPGQPKAIAECLDAVMAAVPYCVDLIGGPYLTTDPEHVDAFRPKSAQRPPA